MTRAVRVLDHARVELSDGTRLAGRVWLPEGGEAVPAILDFLPYRYGDLMAVRDSTLYPYIAARGYACARFDLRGTGNSEGIIDDEYSEQELADGEEVIAWLADQPWCDGGVGMTGISWGGFNSLQIAARRPPALKAIITLCASDDRYSDDVHYRGGSILAIDMLQWAVSMLTWNALPPDPSVAGDSWREMWEERIEKTPAFIEPWMAHQRRDDYWRHGSVCENYGDIRVPVFAVGGWADGYTDAILRLLAGLEVPRKGLIGPWSHAYPHASVPGPRIGYLEESIRWWDHWLKGVENGIMDEPRLRYYMQEYTAPASFHDHWPGRWLAEETWPPPPERKRTLSLYCRTSSSPGLASEPGDGSVVLHRGPETAGLDAGALTADGGAGDWPGDQRHEDGRSVVFDSAPLAEEVELVGVASARLELSTDRELAAVVVRLCDVAPSGESLLVTRGMLNLARRNDFEETEPMKPGRPEQVRVPMKAIAHRFAEGHRIRLAVSSTYWPWLWPAPHSFELALRCGEGTQLELPLRPAGDSTAAEPSFGPPEQPAGLGVEVLERRPNGRKAVHDLGSGETELFFDWDVGGHFKIPSLDIEMDGSNVTSYRIREGEPLSAAVTTRQSAMIRWPSAEARVVTFGEMTGDEEKFIVTLTLDALEEGKRVAARQWRFDFPRDGT